MTFYISVATPLPTLQKKLLAQFLEKTRTLLPLDSYRVVVTPALRTPTGARL
jgi:hypothetical protein